MNFQLELKRLMELYRSNEQPIVQFRFRKLKAMNDYYLSKGFPKPCSLIELSLLPAYFQEAIYDGINWSKQDAGLEQLELELELDSIFDNSGKIRKELSSKEFRDYIKFSDAAINLAKF